MVKVQTKKVWKKYKPNMPPYEYPQHFIPVPMKRNPEMTPFLKKQLDFDIDNDEIKVKVKKTKGVKSS
jgi:hypothetical protein